MDFVGTALFWATLLGWMLLARQLFQISLPASFFAGVQLIILSLYIFALFDYLLPGVYIIEIVGIIYLCASLYTRPKSINFTLIIRKFYFAIPFLAFTTTIPQNFRFTMSDEFPSWAANIKTMFAENSLGGIESATRTIANGFYQSYPPFQQLFQYLFLRNTFWSEANVQTSQNILALILLLGAISQAGNSHSRLVFLTWLGAISLYFLFGFSMSNLLADGLLAVQFAACLGFAISSRGAARDYLLLGLLISNLILIKPTGFILSLCALLLSVSTLVSDSKKSNWKSTWIKLALLAVPSIFTYLSWQLHLRIIDLNLGTESLKVANLGSEETRLRWAKTWESYKSNFFGSLYGQDNLAGISSTVPGVVRALHISLFIIFTSLAVAQLVLALTSSKIERTAKVKNASLITLLAILYQIFLLLLYMFFFGEYEGTRSAALVRYSGSFFLGWSILVLGILVKRLGTLKYSAFTCTTLVCCLFLAAPSAMSLEVRGKYSNDSKLLTRLNVEKLLPLTLKLTPEDAKIYYIHQGSNGYEKYIFSYLILPRKSNWSCASLGKPLYEGDVWTCDLSLTHVLRGYDYLAIGEVDRKFWEANSQFLSLDSVPTNRGIYKISYVEGEVKLSSIG